MLEAMIDIGDILLKDSDIMKETIKKVPILTKQLTKRYIIKINFDLKKDEINFDIEEMDENSVERYLYLGHQGGANKLQWYVTYERCNNLISQSIPNLYEELEDGDFKLLIAQVIKTFYVDQGYETNIRYRYIIDVDRYFNFEWKFSEIKKKHVSENAKDTDKKTFEFVSNEMTKLCAKMFEIKADQIGLFTICINGKPIAEMKEYIETVKKSMQFKDTNNKKGDKNLTCSVCNSTDNCTSKIDIPIKFYTTNLHIFAHKMNPNNYEKNLILCESCHNKFKAASRFMENELRTRIAGYDVYIIPHVIYGKNLTAKKIKKMAEIINPIAGTGETLITVSEYRKEVEKRLAYLNEEKFIFLLNIVFFRKVQMSTKIQKMIEDVNPSIFSKLSDAFYDALNIFNNYYSVSYIDNISKRANLKFIYFMHAIKLQDGNPTQYQNVLRTYENILNQKTLQRDVVFKNLTDIWNIIWRGKEGFNVSFNEKQTNKQKVFDVKLLDCMYYITFLEKYGSLKGGEGMDTEKLNLNNEITSYINDMGYNEQQAALFLLGILIGAIGREQSKRQRER